MYYTAVIQLYNRVADNKKTSTLKVREVIKRIEADGWYLLPGKKTSHRQYKHTTKPGKVTVPGSLSDELNPKTLKSIWEQAGI